MKAKSPNLLCNQHLYKTWGGGVDMADLPAVRSDEFKVAARVAASLLGGLGYHLPMAPGPDFFLAVNYPWLGYGSDFGRSPWGYSGIALKQSRSTVAAD